MEPLLGAVRGQAAPSRARNPGRAGGAHARPEVDGSRVAAIGFLLRRTLAYELALTGADIRAAVGFHSGLAVSSPGRRRSHHGQGADPSRGRRPRRSARGARRLHPHAWRGEGGLDDDALRRRGAQASPTRRRTSSAARNSPATTPTPTGGRGRRCGASGGGVRLEEAFQEGGCAFRDANDLACRLTVEPERQFRRRAGFALQPRNGFNSVRPSGRRPMPCGERRWLPAAFAG